MSRSPEAHRDNDALGKYRDGWRMTARLLREGKSFSGHEPNCAFLNCDGTSFADVSAVTGLNFPDDGRAVCVTDWDHDGDLDLWLRNRTGPRLRLMRNDVRIGNRPQASAPDLDKDASFVAIRLQGTDSNRDGIGARVTLLDDGGNELAQTVRAGGAFLSQSSKWLHFGIGDRSPTKVTVRWPSGRAQEFRDVDANQRYVINEGESVISPVPISNRNVRLAESNQRQLLARDTARTFLSNPLPLPLLSYESSDGTVNSVSPDGGSSSDVTGRATLVLLVASWCPSCRAELDELLENGEKLREAKIGVLVLSLDNLDLEHRSDAGPLRALNGVVERGFRLGTVDEVFLQKLQLAQSIVLNRVPNLAVPSSLLVDDKGALIALYRGRVEAETVLADACHVVDTLEQRRDRAAPFSGRWMNPPRHLLYRAVASMFAENGFSDERLHYLRLDTEFLEQQRRMASSPEQRARFDELYAAENYSLGVALMAKREPAAASEYFEHAVQVNPRHVNAMVNLAAIYAEQKRGDEAVLLLEQAVDVDSDSVVARFNLGNALSAAGRFDKAIGHYRHLLSLDAERPATVIPRAAIQSRLGRALLESGDVAAGAEHLKKAIQEGSQDSVAWISLAWVRATSTDDRLRNGDEAAKLVSRLVTEKSGAPLTVLEVLAAAKAEQGEFSSAVAITEKMIRLVGDADPRLRERLEKRASTYSAHQPHRDADGVFP